VKPNRLRGLLLALICTLALAAPGGAAAVVSEGSFSEAQRLLEEIRKHRATTWHWQRVMGKRPSEPTFAARTTTRLSLLTHLRDEWKHRALRARARGTRPPHLAQWRCIHRYEGAWTDPNAPYYGGLQMDIQFQRAYGRYLLRRKGTANHWRPAEQMWAAERALRAGRGFHPWPTAARRCGLI
jgi:hypothetical protein